MKTRTGVLLIFVFLQGLLIPVSVHCAYAEREWPVTDPACLGHISYIVWRLDYVPETYFSLDDPDQYILEAIAQPGEWIVPLPYNASPFFPKYCNLNCSGESDIVISEGEGTPWMPFQYNGTFYAYFAYTLGDYMSVKQLDDEPESYVTVNDPGKRLLSAIQNPGKWVVFGPNECEWIGGPFKYEGKFYEEEKELSIDWWPSWYLKNPPQPAPATMAAGSIGLAMATAVGIIATRRRRNEDRSPKLFA